MFIDNTVQVLIPFKEGDGSPLKLHIHLRKGVWMLEEKGKNFLRGGRKMYGEAIQNLLSIVCLMALQKRVRGF